MYNISCTPFCLGTTLLFKTTWLVLRAYVASFERRISWEFLHEMTLSSEQSVSVGRKYQNRHGQWRETVFIRCVVECFFNSVMMIMRRSWQTHWASLLEHELFKRDPHFWRVPSGSGISGNQQVGTYIAFHLSVIFFVLDVRGTNYSERILDWSFPKLFRFKSANLANYQLRRLTFWDNSRKLGTYYIDNVSRGLAGEKKSWEMYFE